MDPKKKIFLKKIKASNILSMESATRISVGQIEPSHKLLGFSWAVMKIIMSFSLFIVFLFLFFFLRIGRREAIGGIPLLICRYNED